MLRSYYWPSSPASELDDCELLSLMTYLGFVWALCVSLCLAPGKSFGQTATLYSRVVAQAERIAYLAAQRSALASQVATAALAPSATSFAVRLVAGPVGWAALGVSAGLVLAQMYYSQPDLAAIKQAASRTDRHLYVQTFNGQTYPVPTNQFVGSGPRRLRIVLVVRCLAFRGTPPPGMTAAVQGTGGVRRRRRNKARARRLKLKSVIPRLSWQPIPRDSPRVIPIDQHTSPVGTTGTTQPADNTVSQPVFPSEMPTTVKPKPVPAGDITVVDNVPPPASTPQQNTQQQTTTTTTTTTQNPDGSTTQAGRDRSDDLLYGRQP